MRWRFLPIIIGTATAVPLIAVGIGATAQAATATAYVRVNQLGYPDAAKRAYLMSSTAETGATFSVKNSAGSTVYTAAIGANLGSWSSSYPDVYALDFDSVTTPGTYSISVTGPVAATSPSFVIDTAQNVYAAAMANALSFYQNERDGPNYIPSALRTAPGPPQRRERHDVPHAELQRRQRPVLGEPDVARDIDGRVRRVVGRG